MWLVVKTTIRRRTGAPARIRRRQRELSDRAHATGDDHARQHGWEIAKGTGRFGFGARTYRDPRFEDRRRRLLTGAGE